MLISVIIPVYNVEPYIEACLGSIIESELDCEVIMVDDRSMDGGSTICKKYAETYHNFSFFTNNGKGPSDARNMGVEKAKGEYIWFVDSDDLISGDFKILKWELEMERPDVITFDAAVFNETRDIWNLNHYDRRSKLGSIEILSGKDFFEKYYLSDAYRDSACLNIYRKEFLDKNGIRFTSGLLYEDTEFTFHVYMEAETVKYLPQIYYKRRYRYGSTMTTGITEKKVRDYFDVLKRNTETIKKNRASRDLNHVFTRYVFDLYWVQLDRIQQSDLLEKEKYYRKACETFFQAFQGLLFDKKNLSEINMLLTYMNRLEGLTGMQVWEQKTYEWQGAFYHWGELKQEFLVQHKALVSEVLRKLPLDKCVSVGVYGIGKHTERMLEAYRKYIGTIKAVLIFLDSNMLSYSAIFDGCEVLNIRDIPRELDSIIISSYRYQNEMYQKLIEMESKANIIRLYLKAEDTFDYFI